LRKTGFSAHVCLPVQENYFLGFLLDDGSLITGDIWLVGDDGIVLTHETVEAPQDDCQVSLGLDPTEQRIRVDVVGDPLFRQRLCASGTVTPKFLKQLTLTSGDNTIVLSPDAQGRIGLTAGRLGGESTVLRITHRDGALRIDTVGGQTAGN
jgi:hypothetical protein